MGASAWLLVLVLGLVTRQQLSYPRVWDDIHLGMTRQEVHDRVGSPGHDGGEIKGAFWIIEKANRSTRIMAVV